MPQEPGLSIESATQKRVTYVRLMGSVDTSFEPASISDKIQGKDVVIDLRALRFGSSEGTKKWAQAIESLSSKTEHLVFVDCPRAVVTELNLSSRLAESVLVASVQVRHVCKKCNSISKLTYDLSENRDFPRRGLKKKCGRCGFSMVVDEDLSSYFAFRRHGNQRVLDSEIKEAVSNLPRVLGRAADNTGEQSGSVPCVQDSQEQGGWREVIRSRWARLAEWQRVAAVGGGVALISLIIVLAAMVGTSSLEEQNALLEQYLRDGQLEEAETLLSKWEQDNDVPVSLLKEHRARIEAARKQRLDKIRSDILQAFQEGKYTQIISAVQGVETIEESDIHVAFAVGESYRLMSRLSEAAPYYRIVVDAPNAGRLMDDALFWHAESLLLQGKEEEAAGLFERVIKLRRSNFVKSAKRRLATIRNKASGTKDGATPP